MEPTREIYWNISGVPVMYLLLAIAALVFAYGIRRRYSLWMSGRGEDRSDRPVQRLLAVLKQVFTHERLFRRPFSGLFHSMIFGSFILLFVGTFVVFLQADLGLNVMRGPFYLYFQSLTLDVFGLLCLAGVLMAAAQRYLGRIDRLQSNRADAVILIGLAVVLASGFMIEGLRICATRDPWGKWSPVGWLVARALEGTAPGLLASSHRILWWFHLSVALALFAYLPYSKLLHILLGPANIYFRSMEPVGVTVKPIDFDTAEKLGAERFCDFSWKQLMDLDACTECGRCQDSCPVHLAGQSLSPKQLVLGIRGQMEKAPGNKDLAAGKTELPSAVVGSALSEDALWSCRTCRACMEECPVFVEHIPKLVELRRFEAMEQARMPATLQQAIECLETRGHPFRGTPLSRSDWHRGMNIPVLESGSETRVLYWVGCSTALNEDLNGISRALASILADSGIKFGILGEEEACCGDPARRLGNEYLFSNLVNQNLETFNRYSCKTIITNCPHCYNVLKHEYAQFGADLDVYHHSEFLWKLFSEGKLNLDSRILQNVTYHDPCYLGRYNGIYETPRKLTGILSANGLLEMNRCGDRSFCCGGGGGGAWMSEEGKGKRVNVARSEQALATGASTIVTACPFCMMMMRDGIKTVDGESPVRVADLAELVRMARHEG
jgi:Fe-S oxidoreductase/nitrate reductase gamma subunit